MAKATLAACCLATALMPSCYAASAASSDVTCDGNTAVFRHKAELPQGILAWLGFEMADASEPFQSTDAIVPGEEGLPSRRFISAMLRDCHLYLHYERGGRGAGRNIAFFDYIDGAWVLRGFGDG
jgi:hypothetical protein